MGWNVEPIDKPEALSDITKTREEANTSTLINGKTGVETGVKDEKTREKILNLIKINPSITARELASCLPISLKGVEWQIKQLREQKIIRHIGSTKGGHWEIITADETAEEK